MLGATRGGSFINVVFQEGRLVVGFPHVFSYFAKYFENNPILVLNNDSCIVGVSSGNGRFRWLRDRGV